MKPLCVTAILLVAIVHTAVAQPAPPEEGKELQAQLQQLTQIVERLKREDKTPRDVADVEIFAKGVEWCLRHEEFYLPRNGKGKSQWPKYCSDAIQKGIARGAQVMQDKHPWSEQVGSTIRGYVSRVDGSVQPYALSLPADRDKAKPGHRWPLHVKLHGRGGTRNEVRFFAEHSGKKPQEGQNWIQLDVFGRTDNAYRWSGETDVFEAIADVRRRYRIDDRRITLWGFSMGGAGAWHLGLHYPSMWSSVGPGAGFVDFYKYQNQSEQRPIHEHRTLRIYDAIDYALNMANVPVCTYGGELDKQLVASTSMVDRAKELNVPVKLIVGKGMGHKFSPESFKQFMAFHKAESKTGRPRFPGRRLIRFQTWTLKYNRCEWATIEELEKQYEPTLLAGGIDRQSGNLRLRTLNIAALRIAREIASRVQIDDSDVMPLRSAADELLPDVYFVKNHDGEWQTLSYDASRAFDSNPNLQKRHNLQGPIDDAFMESFVCVRGTAKPWSQAQHDWAEWTLARFEREFDKWLRGRAPVVNDVNVTDELIERNNIVLFGDPGSNGVLAKLVDRLPVKWTRDGIEVAGTKYDPDTHGLSLIFPNPLNPRRYVVINSGHTMHEKDFKASNSWLFPRLGDIAVQKFARKGDSYTEETVWAEIFNSAWKLPEAEDE